MKLYFIDKAINCSEFPSYGIAKKLFKSYSKVRTLGDHKNVLWTSFISIILFDFRLYIVYFHYTFYILYLYINIKEQTF